MKLTEGIRFLASNAPLLGIVPKPEKRPNGVSAIVRVRGDEEWVEPSLLSIQEFADEILVLDNKASAQTRKVLEQLKRSLGDLLTIETCHDLNIVQLSNSGLKKASFRWIIRWDADFVAHTCGNDNILNLRHYLLELDPKRYYLVYLPTVELACDLFHQFPDLRIRNDGQVHTSSRRARYVSVRRNLITSALASPDRVLRESTILSINKESLKVPKFYQILKWKKPSYFHVNVKSGWHTLQRHFWLEWLGKGDFKTHPTLKSYTLAQIQDRWGFRNPEEAIQHFMALYCEGLDKYDFQLCGSYPALLKPYLVKPKYRVLYKDGRIIGRTENHVKC
jgi:glycosyltransferase involved in cell wall biosynthesis